MPDRTVADDSAPDLWLRWQRGEPIDLGAFFAGPGVLSASQLAAVLRVDQRGRWAIGERVAAADYFRYFPALTDDPELAVELIYGEFLLREELGEAPALEEYQRAYPDHASRLAIQVELHRALEGRAAESSEGDGSRGRDSPPEFGRRPPTPRPGGGACRPRRATRSSRSWAAAAWASSTRPATPGWTDSWP